MFQMEHMNNPFDDIEHLLSPGAPPTFLVGGGGGNVLKCGQLSIIAFSQKKVPLFKYTYLGIESNKS